MILHVLVHVQMYLTVQVSIFGRRMWKTWSYSDKLVLIINGIINTLLIEKENANVWYAITVNVSMSMTHNNDSELLVDVWSNMLEFADFEKKLA